MKKTEGYLYIATGTQYLEEAITSVKSLRQCNPHVHATLITDKPVNISFFDEIKILDINKSDSRGLKNFKVQGIQHSPYDRTIFVDTDTFFIEDCKELFPLLQHHDLLISHSPGDCREVKPNGTVLEGYTPYNCGVIVFNNNATVNNLFKEWHSLCLRKIYKGGDQPPFMHALLTSPIKLYVLQPIYNFRTPFLVAVPALKVKILHGRGKDFNKIKKIVNRISSKQRVWVPRENMMIIKPSKYPYKSLINKSIQFAKKNLPKSVFNFIKKKIESTNHKC